MTQGLHEQEGRPPDLVWDVLHSLEELRELLGGQRLTLFRRTGTDALHTHTDTHRHQDAMHD